MIEADELDVDLGGFFGRDAEQAAAATAALTAAATAESAAAALLTATAASTAESAAAATTLSTAAELGDDRHGREGLGQLDVHRLTGLVGDDHAAGVVALGDDLDVEVAVLHAGKELDLFGCDFGRGFIRRDRLIRHEYRAQPDRCECDAQRGPPNMPLHVQMLPKS